MPERTSYAPGTPSWVDLSTPDPDAAKAFYAAVLGWDYEARDTDQGPPYFLARVGGHKVAGMMQQPAAQAQMGSPPVWTTYIAVEDVDATIDAASAAGGQVLMPAMDVMTEGRMAIIADPTGAALGVWQAGDHVGAELVNEHGTLCWNEEQTPDPATAASFHRDVFGWVAEEMDMGDQGPYLVFNACEEGGIAGAMPPQMEGTPAHWSTVFAVDDTDAAAAAAAANGGHVLVDPFDMPIGRLAVLADGQGATFQVIHMNEPV